MNLIAIDTTQQLLAEVVTQYEKTAPTVSRWADTSHIRLNEDMYSVQLVELLAAQALLENSQWEHPNFAANRIYKLMATLGQDTSRHTGY